MATAKKDPMIELYAAIHSVMKEVGYIKKDGKVEFGSTKYNFAGEAQMIKTLRPCMIENGLMLVPHKASHATTSRTGEIINVTYLLIHIGGGTLEVSVVGGGQDKGDKAIPKAMTGAFKYAIRQLFMIETGDDADRDASGKTAQEIEKADEDTRREDAVAGAGFKVAEVNAYAKSIGMKSITSMSDGHFKQVYQRLQSPDGKVKIQTWIDDQNKDSTTRAKAAMEG